MSGGYLISIAYYLFFIISALDKIGMDIKKQSTIFLFIFSRLWYTHVIRILAVETELIFNHTG